MCVGSEVSTKSELLFLFLFFSAYFRSFKDSLVEANKKQNSSVAQGIV